jgi:hypothetical protein
MAHTPAGRASIGADAARDRYARHLLQFTFREIFQRLQWLEKATIGRARRRPCRLPVLGITNRAEMRPHGLQLRRFPGAGAIDLPQFPPRAITKRVGMASYAESPNVKPGNPLISNLPQLPL